jgi:hypothetical protein
MTAFRFGERVELISFPSFPGTVTGARHSELNETPVDRIQGAVL